MESEKPIKISKEILEKFKKANAEYSSSLERIENMIGRIKTPQVKTNENVGESPSVGFLGELERQGSEFIALNTRLNNCINVLEEIF